MRYALALIALTTPLLAQDNDGPAGEPDKPFDVIQTVLRQENGASLFWRAFWMEQAKREGEQAEKLYAEVIEKYAGAPEAPRAIVALIRLRAARGVEVADLVRKLEADYPKLVREIEHARKLAARLRSDFDPRKHADDTPVMLKLKGIYRDILVAGAVRSEDRDFLSDIGAAGHPMLARVLRSSSSAAVKTTTSILVHQHTKEANTIISIALRDPSILYRMTIIDQLRRTGAYGPDLMKVLREIWPQASRSMRRRIASTWAGGTRSDSMAQCYGYLALAVEDEDHEVRRAATSLGDGMSHGPRPEAYVAAVVSHCLKGDAAMSGAWMWLPWQLQHGKLAPRIIKALGSHDGNLTFHAKGNSEKVAEDVAIAMAKMAITRFELGKPAPPMRDATGQFATLAARSSSKAAGLLLDAALRLGKAELAWACGSSLTGPKRAGSDIDQFIVGAAKLRARAIEQQYSTEAVRSIAADAVLAVLGLRTGDLASVIREAKAHPDRGLLRLALLPAFLTELGAERAAQLIPVATPLQLDTLLNSGASLWITPKRRTTEPAANRDHGDPFWAAMLARFHPTATFWNKVFLLTSESEALAKMVAGWVIDRREKEFEWTLPGRASTGYKYGAQILKRREVLDALRTAPLRDRLFAMAADDRHEIGKLALRVAMLEPVEAALVALRKALDSPWDDVNREALDKLPRRGAAGAAILVGYLQRSGLRADLRRTALQKFAGSEAKRQLPYVLNRLDARCEGYEASVMWGVAFEFDRDATVERALKEVHGVGTPDYRTGALKVLTRASDARRIPVFRNVLRESKDTDRVHMVLRTVADQYLIELGPEVLLHLRNPDNDIRDTATTAIERLKFYAEAKKLFDEEAK